MPITFAHSLEIVWNTKKARACRSRQRWVFNAQNLLGIFTGHVHRSSIEMIKGKPQIVSDDNASGGYLYISFLPLEEKDKNLIL